MKYCAEEIRSMESSIILMLFYHEGSMTSIDFFQQIEFGGMNLNVRSSFWHCLADLKNRGIITIDYGRSGGSAYSLDPLFMLRLKTEGIEHMH